MKWKVFDHRQHCIGTISQLVILIFGALLGILDQCVDHRTVATPLSHLFGSDALDIIPEDERVNDYVEPQTYGVIVDCGSSGTRVHIYQWDTKLDYPELLQHIKPMVDKNNKEVSKKFTPGLSAYADKSRKDRERYIAQVADYVAENVPKSRHTFTVVYMMATAGLRLLGAKTQTEIMDQVRSYVNRNYDFRDVQARVISGADEGMYRWISVNSKAGRFLREDTDDMTKTYGVIEMGGASVQVVYQIHPGYDLILSNTVRHEGEAEKPNSGDHLADTYKNQIVKPEMNRDNDQSRQYILHSTTFLGFGGDSAHQAYLDLLISKRYSKEYMKRFIEHSKRMANGLWRRVKNCFACGNNSPCLSKDKNLQENQYHHQLLTIKDPCAPAGYKSSNYTKPTRMLDNKSQTVGFIVDENDQAKNAIFNVTVVGTGDYNKCKRYVEEMLWTAQRERMNCHHEKYCTMDLLGKTFIPFSQLDFIGIGDFYHTTHNMLQMDGAYHHYQIVENTKEICNQPIGELQKVYPNIAGSKNDKVRERIHEECFRAVWIDTLLVKGLGMKEDYTHFTTMNKIHGEDDAEWPLGAVLDKSLSIELVTEGDEQVAEPVGGPTEVLAAAPVAQQ